MRVRPARIDPPDEAGSARFCDGSAEKKAAPVTESASLLAEVRLQSTPFVGCNSAAECKALNPECAYRDDQDVPGRKRLMVF